MIKTIATGYLVVAILSATATADRVELLDGRSFEGIVAVEGNVVTVKMTYGTIEFSKRDIRRIVFKETPQEELTKKLANISPKDTAALFSLATWAEKKELYSQAKELLNKVIALNKDHGEARRLLGFVKIDSKWYAYDKALELARSKLQAAQYKPLLSDILPALAKLPLRSAQQMEIRNLLATTQLQAGKFAMAAKTFSSLAKQNDGAKATRYSAITDILKRSPDGMYILTEPYPPGSMILGDEMVSLKAGPVSLTNPLALEAALRDSAKKLIETGRKLLSEAREIEPTQPHLAHIKTKMATRQFHLADALVTDIAKSYHIEIVRRKISSIRKNIQTDAAKYDQLEETLGWQRLSPKASRNRMTRMVNHLNHIRDGLKNILKIAKPFPRALVLEIKWAEIDLKKIGQKRKILMAELDGGK